MKKIAAVLLIAALLLASMAGCGSSAKEETPAPASQADAQPVAAEAEEAENETAAGVTSEEPGMDGDAALEGVLAIPAEDVEEAPKPETVTANIGDVTFSFTNQGEYYDVTYMYPAEFELEVKEDEDKVRHALRYNVEGYEPPAVGLVISRTNDFSSPEERLADISWTDDIVTEEINGTSWAVGTQTDVSESRLIIYSCAVGEYIYTFSFSSDYPADFDFTDFARVFAENVGF